MKKLLIVVAFWAMACTGDKPIKKAIPKPVTKICHGKPTVIAVIDTGFGLGWRPEEEKTARLCQYGHKNFVDDQNSDKFDTKVPVPTDRHGHGTNIAGIIGQYAKNTNYCLVILKYFDPVAKNNDNLKHTIQAIDYARQIHANFINYSGGGTDFNQDEADAVKRFLDAGGTFVAAAGNEHSDLEKNPYYPAMEDDRVIVVGNIREDRQPARSSNYGKRVNRWEIGEGVTAYGLQMTGTSQSTAIVTGKLVSETKNICK